MLFGFYSATGLSIVFGYVVDLWCIAQFPYNEGFMVLAESAASW
jgi:hypothetical protein